MTKEEGKVFVLAGAMVLMAVAKFGCEALAERRAAWVKALGLDPETVGAIGTWGNFLGGGGFAMALLCLGAAQGVTWGKEREWLKVVVVMLVFLSAGFIMFG